MKIIIDGIERHLDVKVTEKLLKICNKCYTGHADMVVAMIEKEVNAFTFDTYCEFCGCVRAKYLGDLEMHNGNCPNIPF